MSDEPSKMIRVPTPLVEAVRELSRLHRQGRTKAVLEGVQRLVAVIDSKTDIDIDSVTNSISKLSERLDRLESERRDSEADIDIDSVTNSISSNTERLEKVENSINSISLTIADLKVRVSDLEGVDDINLAITSLSELEQSGDINADSDVIAEIVNQNDINADSKSTAESKDCRFDINSTAEASSPDDSNSDSNLISTTFAIGNDSNSTAEVGKQVDIAADHGASSEAELLPQFPNPLSQSALARRLGISDKAIQKQRGKGKESFAEWSRDRDPDHVTWTWEGSGGRGQPLRFVPLGYDVVAH